MLHVAHTSHDPRLLPQERVAAAPRRPLAGEDNTRPSERVLQLWQSASAVCFDVDCEPGGWAYSCLRIAVHDCAGGVV